MSPYVEDRVSDLEEQVETLFDLVDRLTDQITNLYDIAELLNKR